MKYVVFDLDHTLADLHSYLFPLIAFEQRTPSTSQTIDCAYQSFVRRILCAETSQHPIGLLRPGILPIMEELAARRRNKEILSVMIYSNNHYLPSLHLVRDVINTYVGMTLIDRTIHWNHIIRWPDKIAPSLTKTWRTLQIVFGGPLYPADVLFFDDQNHPQLKAILGVNYRQVPPYHHASCFERVANIFIDSIEDGKVDHAALAVTVNEKMVEGLMLSEVKAEVSMNELLEDYEKVLGATQDSDLCPVGECSAFWDGILTYRPEIYM